MRKMETKGVFNCAKCYTNTIEGEAFQFFYHGEFEHDLLKVPHQSCKENVLSKDDDSHLKQSSNG